MPSDQRTGARETSSDSFAAERATYRVSSRYEDAATGYGRALDVLATLAGTLAAIGALVLLGGLIGAALGTIGYQSGLKGNQEELSLGGLIAGVVTLFLAFVIGGRVAARIARHHGARHGLVSAVWMILLTAILAVLGAWFGTKFDVFDQIGLPRWFSKDALTATAIASGLAAVIAMLLGGWLGGRWGQTSRSGASVELVETNHAVTTRPGGITATHTDGDLS